MNLTETEKIVKATKTSLLSRMEANPTDCLTLTACIAETVDLSSMGENAQDVRGLIRNLAAIHREAGCDFEANHSLLQQILA